MKKRALAIAILSAATVGIIFLCLGLVGLAIDVSLYGVSSFFWILLGALFFLASLGTLFATFPMKKSPPPPPFKYPEFEKFMKECKLTFRGHLKLSILFWILAYRKEKAKSFEEAKRDVFLEVRREIPHVRWMDAILQEVQEDLNKVKQ